MTEKRYFKKEWEEEYYIFDSIEISEEKVDEESEYTYNVFADSMQGDEVVNKLNEQEETIQTQKEYITRMGHGTIFEEMKRLKERNQRQYERLKELTDLMFKRDWKTLNDMVDEWEKEEEQLQKYGG